MAGRGLSQWGRLTGVLSVPHEMGARSVRCLLDGLLACVALALVLPASASAATVGLDRNNLRYLASPGERNQVTANVVHPPVEAEHGTWTISDTGAALTPGPGCVALDERTVSCSKSPARLWVDLGDMDDEFRFTELGGGIRYLFRLLVKAGPGNDRVVGFAPWTSFYGGQGDDYLESDDAVGLPGDLGGPPPQLTGGLGNDQLYGGAGEDELNGGGGVDLLNGRGGDDSLGDGDREGAATDAAPGPDVFIGGAGTDSVSYSRRSAAVWVDLADPDVGAGAAGEGDRVTEVENIYGGSGSDVLAGDDGPNLLDGGEGRDRLIGRGGDDSFIPHLPVSWGNPLGANEGGAVSCGPGRDSFPGGVFVGDFLEPDCEIINDESSGARLFSAYPVTVRGERLHYKVRCPQDGYGDIFEPAPCSGVVRLKEAAGRGRLLARGAFSRGKWWNHTVTAKLTALGDRLAKQPNGIKAHVVLRVSAIQPSGPSQYLTSWTVRLHVPR